MGGRLAIATIMSISLSESEPLLYAGGSEFEDGNEDNGEVAELNGGTVEEEGSPTSETTEEEASPSGGWVLLPDGLDGSVVSGRSVARSRVLLASAGEATTLRGCLLVERVVLPARLLICIVYSLVSDYMRC